ncbi:MAG: hypothetical protein KIT87_26670 [Anaerolineae bacterium]|nr:hypothetical protein [Anaerolineae bacterium]
MEELLLLVIGASALALLPVVPSLRPAAKAAVKGGLAVADGAKAAAVVVVYQADKVRSRSRSDEEAAAVEAPATTVAGDAASGEAATDTAQAGDAASVEAATDTAQAGDAASGEAATDTAQAGDAPATWSMANTPTPGLIDIDGIGPKVVGVLEAAGVTSLEQLANMDEAQLRNILTDAGPRYRLLNPASWPDQARRLLESDR